MRAAGDFLPLLLLALAAALYERRLATLRRKAARVPLNRRLLVWTALVLLAGASAAPLHEAAEELLTFHMVQHVLLGDLAPLALALGLSGPVLRPLLALPAAKPLRVLAHPFVALPLWAGTLVAWHLSPAYDAAVESEALHALEHASFFLAGLAMWMPVAETLPSPAWFTTRAKLVYVVGVRAVGMGLGNVLFWAGSPLYPRYVGREGLSAIEDQQLAGTVMMVEGSLVTIALLCVLFLSALAESERQQTLVEQGVDERLAARAVRYRRAEAIGSRPRMG